MVVSSLRILVVSPGIQILAPLAWTTLTDSRRAFSLTQFPCIHFSDLLIVEGDGLPTQFFGRLLLPICQFIEAMDRVALRIGSFRST